VIWVSVIIFALVFAGLPLLLDRFDRRRPEEDLSKQTARPQAPRLGDEAERWLKKQR